MMTKGMDTPTRSQTTQIDKDRMLCVLSLHTVRLTTSGKHNCARNTTPRRPTSLYVLRLRERK